MRVETAAMSCKGWRTVVSATQEGGCLHVVEPDDRKVFGDAQPVLPGGLIDAHRLQVASGEDRGGAVRVLQQRHRLRVAAFGREITFGHQFVSSSMPCSARADV